VFERLIWLVPAAVAAAGIKTPRAALVVLAACLPLFGRSRGAPGLAALDLASLAAILLSLRAPRPRASSLDRAVVAFVVVGAASLVPLVYHPPSWQPSVLLGLLRALPDAPTWSALFSWRALLDLLLGAGLFFACRRAFAGQSTRPLALGVGAGLALLVAVGLAEAAGLVDLSGFRSIAAEGRLHALFSNSGWLGEYVIIASPLALAGLFSAGERWRAVAYALAGLVLATLVLSQQRGGWLAALAQTAGGAILVGAARWREPALRRAAAFLALTALLAVAGAAAVRPGAAAGVAGRFSQSDLYLRPKMWRTAATAALERPALGWGLGSYEAAIARQPSAAQVPGGAHGEAHSTLLHVATERGLAGILSLLLLAVTAAASARREIASSQGDRAMAVGRALALVGVAFYALVQYVFLVPAVGALVWLVLGSTVAPPPAGGRTSRWAVALAAAAVLLGAVRAVATSPLEAAGDRSYGFHAPEPDGAGGSVEWTEAKAARRLPCSGRWLVVDLANGHPLGPRHPARVTLRAGRRTLAVVDVPGGWQTLRVPVGDACGGGALVVEIAVRSSFRPLWESRDDASLRRSNDERELGVALRGLRVE
jgi:O-antigen ligase